MLRESQESALQISRADLERMFNLKNLGAVEPNEHDATSRFYFEKIKASREKLRRMLPLFLQSQRIVAKHKHCLKVIQRQEKSGESDKIPHQLQLLIEKGEDGLNGYSKMLENVAALLKKNQYMTEQLQRYQENIQYATKKTIQAEKNVQELRGDVTQQALVLERIEKSKGRIQDLLSGMFNGSDQHKKQGDEEDSEDNPGAQARPVAAKTRK